jgi:hypothetical protein
MISDKIRNRVRQLQELTVSQGILTKKQFKLAMDGFLADAEAVAEMEKFQSPEPCRVLPIPGRPRRDWIPYKTYDPDDYPDGGMAA